MNVKGNLSALNHIAIVTPDVEAVTKNWATLFGFDAPEVQALPAEYASLFLGSMNPRYRGKPRTAFTQPWAQAIIEHKNYFFEFKSPGVFGYNEAFYQTNGTGVAFFGITENKQSETLIAGVTALPGASVADEMLYPEDIGCFTILDTAQTLGVGLCVNAYKHPTPPPQHPAMPSFCEMCIAVPNLADTLQNWQQAFEIESIRQETLMLSVAAGKGTVPMTINSALIENADRFPVRLMETVNPEEKIGVRYLALALNTEDLSRIKQFPNIEEHARFMIDRTNYILFDSVDVLGVDLAVQIAE